MKTCYINRLRSYARNAMDYAKLEIDFVASMHNLQFSNWRLKAIEREAKRIEARARAERN